MKNRIITIGLLLMVLAACKQVRGVVTDESGKPIKGAMVSLDCSSKAVVTSASGYFSFKVRSKGKNCKIRSWNPADTLSATTIDYYLFKKGGSIELTIKKTADEH